MSISAEQRITRTTRGKEQSAPMALTATQDAAFTAFMTSASARLERTAWLLTGNEHAAKQLLQASLVKASVAWPRIRDGEALAYTRRINGQRERVLVATHRA